MDTPLSMDMAMHTPPMDTSWESVKLSHRELLFTLVLPPHPPSEAHRVQELPSMDTHLSMDMVMPTPPMVTSWESVKLSPKVLLFTLVLPPHLSTRVSREPMLSTLMLLTMVSMGITDTSKSVILNWSLKTERILDSLSLF